VSATIKGSLRATDREIIDLMCERQGWVISRENESSIYINIDGKNATSINRVFWITKRTGQVAYDGDFAELRELIGTEANPGPVNSFYGIASSVHMATQHGLQFTEEVTEEGLPMIEIDVPDHHPILQEMMG